MKILADYSLKELQELLNLPKFRVKQIFDAIMQAKDYNQTTIPKKMYEQLQGEYILKPVEIFEVYKSTDGTKKYLSNGSPLPISTMLVKLRSLHLPLSALTVAIQLIISPALKLRISPLVVDAQNLQPIRHPTCVDIHIVLP